MNATLSAVETVMADHVSNLGLRSEDCVCLGCKTLRAARAVPTEGEAREAVQRFVDDLLTDFADEWDRDTQLGLQTYSDAYLSEMLPAPTPPTVGEACTVPGCPGDYRYAPPGRGHTCTLAEQIALAAPTPPTVGDDETEALARVIWDAEGDGFAQMEWARKYARAVLAAGYSRTPSPSVGGAALRMMLRDRAYTEATRYFPLATPERRNAFANALARAAAEEGR